MSKRILFIEDDITFRNKTAGFLRDGGYEVLEATSAEEGLKLCEGDYNFQVILLDQQLPGVNGLQIHPRLHKLAPLTPVIFLTSYDDAQLAVSVMKTGAFDYLIKPVDKQELLQVIGQAVAQYERRLENRRLVSILRRSDKYTGLITRNRAILDILEMVRKVAPLGSSVVITGESGVGKELMARTVHNCSGPDGRPFVAVNCASLHDDLLASALFGHEKGAFTGAIQTKKGCFEEAHGGTLFLDEVGDMNAKMQASLLRVLQEKEFCRLGSYKSVKTDFRLICATNRNLETDMANNRFREDLYYRINVLHLHIPPLRERPADIALLTKYFIEKWNKKFGKRVTSIAPEVFDMLNNHSWPGNGRELENCTEQMVALCEENQISVEQLPSKIRATTSPPPESILFEQAKEKFEKEYLCRSFDKCGGKVTEMTKITGISRPNLYRKLKKYGIIPSAE